MGWNTMQAAARDQCFDAFDDGRDAADVPSSSTSSPIRPRAKTIGLSVADGSDKSPPINNNGSSTINASTARPVHNRHPSSLSSKGAAASNQPVPEVDDSTIDTELPYHRERTCRSMHILSSPTIIEDTRRYERNSLLFAVGFVLHRSVDPRPFWPVLSNLSLTLRDMEVESEFLSNASTRSRVQIVLEDVLVSLNSGIGRCHLLLDDANLLGLQLFRPPPPPVPPVPNHAVPILLRPEWADVRLGPHRQLDRAPHR